MFEPGRFLRCKEVSTSQGKVRVIEFTYTRGLIFKSLSETSQISFSCTELKWKEHLLTEEDRILIFKAIEEVNKPVPLDEKAKARDIPFCFLTLLLGREWGKDPKEIEDKYSRQQIIEWCHALGKLNEWICKDSEKDDDTPSIEGIEGDSFFQEMKEKYGWKGGEKI